MNVWAAADRYACLSGMRLSDDQTSPTCPFSNQSEPGTLERRLKWAKAKEAASTAKLNSGETPIKYAWEGSF